MSMGAWIKAKMSLDASGVKAGVDTAKKEVGGFKSSLGGLSSNMTKAFGAAAAVAAVVKFTKASIEMAIRTKEVADQAGLTVEQLQAIYSEAIQVTGGFKAASTGLIAFRTAQQEALDGNETQIKAFGRMGISLEDIANKSTPQLLEAVAKGYKAVGDFGALVDLFGKKNAGKLEEALIALADNGFEGLERKATKAGMVLGDEFSARLDQVGDAMDRLKLKAEVFWDKSLIKMYDGGRWLVNKYKGIVSFWSEFLAEKMDGKSVGDALVSATEAQKKTFDTEQQKDKNDDKMFRQERAQQKQKAEEREAALRKGKIADIYAKEAEESKKLDDKQAALDEKAAAKSAAAAKKIADTESELPVKEIANGTSEAARPRYDTLREIGANILGSGKIGGVPLDRNAELIRINRQTAENTARIADKLDSPAVTRLGQSNPVY